MFMVKFSKPGIYYAHEWLIIKMPTIGGILTLINRINFMLSPVEH